MPVERVVSPEHVRARSLGWIAVRWIEHFVLHGPGDIQGTPMNVATPGAIPLSDELVELTVDVYALDPAGRRQYDSAFYSRPKGADKSGHAGRLGLFEALGPCRFAGFAKGGEVYEWMDFRYVYQPGEPMGHVVQSPFLRILATEEEQAGNVYDTMYFNLDEGPLREWFPRKDAIGLTRVFLPGGGEIRPSTASNAAKDGGLETWCSFDETHLYTTPELRRMHATVRRNLTKRTDAEGWSCEMSTMYAPGQKSVAELSHERAKLIREGKLRLPRAYFNHRQAPEGVDLTDEAAIRSALAEAYGDAASYTDFDRKLAEIWDPVNEVDDSLRYYFNQVTAHTQAWISAQQWDALAVDGFVPAAGELVTIGLQGSPINGDVGLVGCDVETGRLFKIAFWHPEDGEEVAREAVDEAVRDAFARWDVVGFYSDRQFWESHIDQWEAKYAADLCVESSKRHPIQYDLAGHKVEDDDGALVGKRAVVKSAEDFRAAIVESARLVQQAPADERAEVLAAAPLTHDGDLELRQQFLNARRQFVPGMGVTFGKEHDGSPNTVNGAKAAMLARQCRQDYVALPDSRKRQTAEAGAFFA